MQITDNKPNQLTLFEQDLALIVEAVRLLKKTYPNRWQSICQQALNDGELTVSDALSGLVTAQTILEQDL